MRETCETLICTMPWEWSVALAVGLLCLGAGLGLLGGIWLVDDARRGRDSLAKHYHDMERWG